MNVTECLERVVWNWDREPVRTADVQSIDERPRSNKDSGRRTFNNVKVGRQSFLQYRVSEQTSIGNVAHQELHNDEEFVYGLVETWCSSWLR